MSYVFLTYAKGITCPYDIYLFASYKKKPEGLRI